MQHNPAQVSQWLSSMLNIIPGDILSLLAQRVKSHQIGGHTFSGMLNNHEFFNEMGIEGLTMLHCKYMSCSTSCFVLCCIDKGPKKRLALGSE